MYISLFYLNLMMREYINIYLWPVLGIVRCQTEILLAISILEILDIGDIGDIGGNFNIYLWPVLGDRAMSDGDIGGKRHPL